PEDLIQDFRTSYNPRIAVTVDMIATGTDVKPIEIVMFLRTVKSRVLYEQMKGRGGRVMKSDELRSVTPDARVKTHFVLIDCVGVSESPMNDARPLDRKKFISFKKLLQHVTHGGADPEMVSSLASRLTRLDRQLGPPEHERVAAVSDGSSVRQITRGIVDALDADAHVERAR
ncbi:MAG: restriction endonuclease subunit R, partial [bacterium]|nr:restriction endonuclease subunit R [bacterium]